MYSSSSSASEHPVYDFDSEHNREKWTDLFTEALQKVQRQVHPSLTTKKDALEYIEKLILQLLGMLCATQPHSPADVEERVVATFPKPIERWAILDAQTALEKGKKKSTLVLPVDRIHPLLTKELLCYKVDMQVTMYIVAVLEYIAADILKLTGNYVKNIKHPDITLQDIKVAMCADKVLMDMFFQDDEEDLSVEEEFVYVSRSSMSYEDLVKDLVLEETQYMRDLNLIIKVFRAPFVELYKDSKDIEVIFSNILEIHSLTANLLSMLEDTIEVTDDGVPLVGSCFEDLAETAEFDAYEKYAEDILKPNGRERLNILLGREDATRKCSSIGKGFRDAAKYVLPKLRLGPIYHCLYYFDILKALIDTTPDNEDKESLQQSYGLLNSLKVELERKLITANIKSRKPGDASLRFKGRIAAERDAALNKMNELQKSIDGWEGKNIGQSCNEFIMDGTLFKATGRGRITERYVFLFDGLLILTKQNTKRSSVTGPVAEYKLKEKFNIRKIDVFDKEEIDDPRNAFEIQVRDSPSIVLSAKTAEEKNIWMGHLVSLLTRSYLERLLDGKLKEEVSAKPLKLPPPELYRFAEEDSEENVVFEENQTATESPLIKGGTLIKLVERLTYHTYADPKFVRTFLTTYRTFCKRNELLELLTCRFDIPNPQSFDEDQDQDALVMSNLSASYDLKRFRKEYSKPVQFRVLNVLRHWVDQHWYDFEMDKDLQIQLQIFLDSVKGKAMRKGADTISKIISRKQSEEKVKTITLKETPPPIEWHITKKYEDFDLMTLHPKEIARQVTLLEFDLYKAVKPSEMVGSVWIKKQKKDTSPNLLRMIQHSTRFTFWLEKCIVEAENFEERVAVVTRILEIMMVFQELNNFNGVLEVVSALNSAPVHRLEHSFEEVDQKNHKVMKAFDEAKELNSDHFKRYVEKLRSIDPPCVPFLGMYLTNILLTEEGNPDFLPNRPGEIINFSKRRKVAEITAEIQQYQNQPYCLTSQADIRAYFENLTPLGDMSEKEFNDYLYEKSLEIEPRNSKQPVKYERRREYSLKSPGIKPMPARHSTSTLRGDKNQPMSLPANTTVPSPQDEGTEPLLVSSCGATPPTPGTPLTPPHDSSGDNSVFATVLLPSSASTMTGMSTASLISGLSNDSLVSTLLPEDRPPPLPPRRKRESSTTSMTYGTELSPVRPGLEPPMLPPRDDHPPPLPPRRMDSSHAHDSLPIGHGLLPDRSNSHGALPMPQLPPRTYRQTSHHRQQSS